MDPVEVMEKVVAQDEFDRIVTQKAHQLAKQNIEDRKNKRENWTTRIMALCALAGVLAFIGFIAFQMHQSGIRDLERVGLTAQARQECIKQGGVWNDAQTTCNWSRSG